MASSFGPVSVFVRVGDCGEYEIGRFTPEVRFDGTDIWVAFAGPLADLFREAASAMESADARPRESAAPAPPDPDCLAGLDER